MSVKPNVIKLISKNLPVHKNNKRIWISTDKIRETKLIEKLTYCYKINKNKKQLIILTNENDNRKITIRKTNNTPIIDINNEDITELFKNIDKITVKIYNHKIIIEPLKEVLEQNRARKKLNHKNITFVDVFAGSGTLTEAFKKSGMIPISAIECNDEYLCNFEKNNKNTIAYHTSVTEMDIDLLPKNATIVIGGIPCENYSTSGISKQKSLNKKSKEEGLTGHLGYYFLQAIEKIRPSFVVIEEVIGFKNSSMMNIIRKVLYERGYKLTEKILKANEYGSLTKRKRFCCVATIGNKPFTFSEKIVKNSKTIKDILEIDLKDRIWIDRYNSKSIAYLLDKEIKDKLAGKGFRIARTYLSDTIAATITKGYFRNQATNPVIVHPEDENKFSWFTPRELARLQGLEDNFILPVKKNKAGEILGQGVSQEPFIKVAEDIKNYINSKG